MLRKMILAVLSVFFVLPASAGVLKITTDTSDPAPKAAFEQAIKQFEAENPDVTVEWTVLDHEGYKTAINNFLTANPPDVITWYAGNRMLPYITLLEDVSDLWESENLGDTLTSAKPSMTIDGKQWGVPYTYYQWGIYYRADIFADLGLSCPTDWQGLLDVNKTLQANNITPFTIGTKYLWTTAGWFDYLNLRVNGHEFHAKFTATGNIPYVDRRIADVFDRWDELVKSGAFLENHAGYSWQEALAPMVNGEAAMYLMGNFAVAPLLEAGLTKDQLGFCPFPTINPDVARAEDAPTDTIHIPLNAENKADARRFLAFFARADTQTAINKELGQLPVNNQSTTKDDKYLVAGFELLSTSAGLAQFYDRDAPAQMAAEGMKGFQEYMVKPQRRNAILRRLDRVRKKVY